MKKQIEKLAKDTTALAIVLVMTTSCSAMEERINNIGKAPALASIENPTAQKDYKPISLPMPLKERDERMANSLWGVNRQTFFKDQRAGKIGDILTVIIEIDDKADVKNSTERTRTGNEANGVTNLLGLEGQLTKVLPEALTPESLAKTDSSSKSKGEGTISRNEKVELKLAATITQKLPNGNLVILGRQQVRVNNELRDLTMQGIIRPEDILNNNSISYEKIAEARISYGGQGNISELQQPRYGQQLFEIVYPF